MFTPHALVTFGGSLNEMASADEIWQCGVRLSHTEGFDEQTYVAEVADHLAAWFTAGASVIPAAVKLKWLKCALIGADGKYPSPTYAPAFADYTTPPAGSVATPSLPSFCSIAYSWKSEDRRRGPASNGRIYPPNFGLGVIAGTSRITDADADTTAGQAVVLLTALQNAGGTQIVSPCIFSKVDGSASVITSVRVGRVIDTQRRRRNAVPETYSAAAFS